MGEGYSGEERRADALEVEEKARALAVEHALRNERIDQRFTRHDARFALINGSIEKTALRLAQLEQAVTSLQGTIEKMAEAGRTRDALEAQRTAEIRRANDNQVTGRMWRVGVVTVVVMLLGLIVTIVFAIIAQGHHP